MTICRLHHNSMLLNPKLVPTLFICAFFSTCSLAWLRAASLSLRSTSAALILHQSLWRSQHRPNLHLQTHPNKRNSTCVVKGIHDVNISSVLTLKLHNVAGKTQPCVLKWCSRLVTDSQMEIQGVEQRH